MKTDNARRREGYRQADCHDCGWCIVDLVARVSAKEFLDIVRAETCMCVPHRHRVGQRFDDGTMVIMVRHDKNPVQVYLDGNIPSLARQYTYGVGKRFRVSKIHPDGSVSFIEETPLNGPRAR